MRDTRGVERGRCSKCSCTEYELEKNSTRADCAYCACPAPAHEELVAGSSSSTTPSTSKSPGTLSMPTFDRSVSGNSNIAESQIVCVLGEEDHFLGDFLPNISSSVNKPSSQEIAEALPKVFPKPIMKALEKDTLDANQKSRIVRDTVSSLTQKGFVSNACMEVAARKLGEKFSPMRDPELDPTYKFLGDKLKRRRDRYNKTDDKAERENDPLQPGTLSPAEAKEKMLLDWARGERAVSAYKENMAITKQMRDSEVTKHPGIILLRHYPSLQLKELLIQEFVEEIKLSKEDMELNWSRALTQLSNYLLEKDITVQQLGSFSEHTLNVLENLHKGPILYNKKHAELRSGRVLEKFQSEVTHAEMTPHPRDSPRLLVRGEPGDTEFSISCYLDTLPYFQVTDGVEALILMLAMYYRFKIDWPSNCRLAFVTLMCAIGGGFMVKAHVARNNSFKDFLVKLKLWP